MTTSCYACVPVPAATLFRIVGLREAASPVLITIFAIIPTSAKIYCIFALCRSARSIASLVVASAGQGYPSRIRLSASCSVLPTAVPKTATTRSFRACVKVLFNYLLSVSDTSVFLFPAAVI